MRETPSEMEMSLECGMWMRKVILDRKEDKIVINSHGDSMEKLGSMFSGKRMGFFSLSLGLKIAAHILYYMFMSFSNIQ